MGISAAVGAVSGGVAATGLGVFAQAGITAAASALGDGAEQLYAMHTGRQKNYNPWQTVGAAAMGFSTSIIGSAAGKLAAGGKIAAGEEMISRGRSSAMVGELRRTAGRSYTSYMRSAKRLIANGTVIRNTGRGLSSVVGTFATARLNALWAAIT